MTILFSPKIIKITLCNVAYVRAANIVGVQRIEEVFSWTKYGLSKRIVRLRRHNSINSVYHEMIRRTVGKVSAKQKNELN